MPADAGIAAPGRPCVLCGHVAVSGMEFCIAHLDFVLPNGEVTHGERLVCEFHVDDVLPAPQGSKSAWGQEMSKNLPAWREAVGLRAKIAMRGRRKEDGPVQVTVRFFIKRPLTRRTPDEEWVTKSPDLDKLCRSVLDAMSGIVYEDDRLVAELHACKVWRDTPGATVVVRSL